MRWRETQLVQKAPPIEELLSQKHYENLCTICTPELSYNMGGITGSHGKEGQLGHVDPCESVTPNDVTTHDLGTANSVKSSTRRHDDLRSVLVWQIIFGGSWTKQCLLAAVGGFTVYVRALGLSHINWAKVTSTPWQGDLEESHINGRKSHQYVRITMAQLKQEDASKRPKSQKTLRTLAHQSNFSLLFNVCRWQITMAHWFQTSSAQRKQITSTCQNYNGTATTTRYFQQTKITENIAHSGASVCFFLIFDVRLWRVSIIFSPMKANHTWC